jgi:hypothetical protein
MSVISVSMFLLLGVGALRAQSTPPKRFDLGVSYNAEHTLKANTSQSFWLEGGAIEVGGDLWHGLGFAANFTGEHTGSIGSSGVPFSSFREVFGPRYRWHRGHKVSLYGEGLVGEANGFGTLFPGPNVAQSQSGVLALQVGGGVDYRISNRFSVRALDAGWVRTTFANSTDNVQNYVRLGAGVVLNLGK